MTASCLTNNTWPSVQCQKHLEICPSFRNPWFYDLLPRQGDRATSEVMPYKAGFARTWNNLIGVINQPWGCQGPDPRTNISYHRDDNKKMSVQFIVLRDTKDLVNYTCIVLVGWFIRLCCYRLVRQTVRAQISLKSNQYHLIIFEFILKPIALLYHNKAYSLQRKIICKLYSLLKRGKKF